MKKKILFLIPNLKHGGAEKVLVNLVNNLDPQKYDITLQTLFDVGVHKGSLLPHIRYIPGFKREFRGNSHLTKLMSAGFWWKLLVKEHYDIAVSYLEGPTSRVLSGCDDPATKKAAWIHIELENLNKASIGFRDPAEALNAYDHFDRIVAVSGNVRDRFLEWIPTATPIDVLYNTNETAQIQELGKLDPDDPSFPARDVPVVCSVGKLMHSKGFDRLMNVHRKLLDQGLAHHICILGVGEEQARLERQIQKLGISNSVTLLGYRTNPYQYVSRCDLYVCSSRREGFSTAVTEALVLGTPVVSTDCSGARELLGNGDEFGIVVENSDAGIYDGMYRMLSDPDLLARYRAKARERGSRFSRTETVRAVEQMLDTL